MDIKLFQQKLNEICTIAEENGKQLSQQQIRDHFDESDLSTSQLVKILQYLKLKGITIEGAEEAASATAAANTSSESGSEEELPGTRAALTAEEQAYLSDYMESFSPEGLDSDDLTSLFQAFAKGDTAAEGALTQFYMAQAAQMAAELNCEEIYLADLIQEANLALLAALKETEPQQKNDAWMRGRIRSGILHAIEEQTQQKFRDDYLVSKVENLESAVKELTDDDDVSLADPADLLPEGEAAAAAEESAASHDREAYLHKLHDERRDPPADAVDVVGSLDYLIEAVGLFR